MPQDLLVRNTADARVLGCLPMADAFEARYGAPYLTIHRADLHDSLWQCFAPPIHLRFDNEPAFA
jgi:salicylate hydroxylase